MTTGATLEPQDPINLLTSTTSALQTAGADVLMSSLFANSAGLAHRVFACAAGSIAIKRVNDSAFVVYPVLQGQYLDGRILAVGGTGSGTSVGMQWIAEV